jgi:hypothetical protein
MTTRDEVVKNVEILKKKLPQLYMANRKIRNSYIGIFISVLVIAVYHTLWFFSSPLGVASLVLVWSQVGYYQQRLETINEMLTDISDMEGWMLRCNEHELKIFYNFLRHTTNRVMQL